MFVHCHTRDELQRAAEELLKNDFQSLRQRVFTFQSDLPEAVERNPFFQQLTTDESVLVEPADWAQHCPRADHQHLLVGPIVEDGRLIGALAATRDTAFRESDRTRMNRLCLHYSSRLAQLPKAQHELTPRENEVAAAVRQGLRNREVARELHITEHTVKQNLKSIYRKLGVRSRTELAARA